MSGRGTGRVIENHHFADAGKMVEIGSNDQFVDANKLVELGFGRVNTDVMAHSTSVGANAARRNRR